MTNNKPLFPRFILVQPKTIKPSDKTRLRKIGVEVIEHPAPHRVDIRTVLPQHDSCELLRKALAVINGNATARETLGRILVAELVAQHNA